MCASNNEGYFAIILEDPTINEIKLTCACDLFKKFLSQDLSLAISRLLDSFFFFFTKFTIRDWNTNLKHFEYEIAEVWLKFENNKGYTYKDCRKFLKMECGICIFQIMHIDFFFSSLRKVYCNLGFYVSFLKITVRGLPFLYIIFLSFIIIS